MNENRKRTVNQDIRGLLTRSKAIAVVGISDDPSRASHRIGKELQRRGYDVYPVNPMLKRWQDLPAYPDLASLPVKVDIVNIFRRSEFVAAIVDEAIASGAKAVWMQLGVMDDAAARKALDAGLDVVMDRCISIELSGL